MKVEVTTPTILGVKGFGVEEVERGMPGVERIMLDGIPPAFDFTEDRIQGAN